MTAVRQEARMPSIDIFCRHRYNTRLVYQSEKLRLGDCPSVGSIDRAEESLSFQFQEEEQKATEQQ